MFKNIFCRLYVFLILSLILPQCPGQYYRSNNRRNNTSQLQGADSQYSREQQKMMLLQQQALESAQKMSSNLQQILTHVNSNSTPDQQLLSGSRESLKESNKFASKYFSDKLKSEYYMLNSWVSYYDGDIKKAYIVSGTAVRNDEEYNDARATQAAMAILSGLKPMAPIKVQNRPTNVYTDDSSGNGRSNNFMRSQRSRNTRRSTRPDQYQQTTPQIQQVSFQGIQDDILQLDVETIDMRLLGQDIPAMDFKCEGQTINFKPGQDQLCLLFWSVPVEPQVHSRSAGSDPNIPGSIVPNTGTPNNAVPDTAYQRSTRERSDQQYNRQGNTTDPSYFEYYQRSNTPPARQSQPENIPPVTLNSVNTASQNNVLRPFEDFEKYYRALASNKSFKFVGINIDSAEHADKVAAFNRRHNYPWPVTSIHTMPDSMFAVAAKTIYVPSMVIVNKEGAVNYAGPADCFLPKLLLDFMVPGGNINLNSVSGKSPDTQNLSFLEALSEKMKQASAQTATTPKTIKPVVKPDTADQDPVITDGFTAAQDYEADQMKCNVINFYNLGRRIPNNYHKSITYYRQLLEKYPDSKYTLEARQYIRKIPDRYLKRWEVTREELGY